MAATLTDLAGACGPERPAAVCRELTKLHEEIVRGSLGELAERARTGAITLRGEFVLVVGERRPRAAATAEADGATADRLESARAEVERLVAGGTARGDAARQVAAATGIPRRQLYGAGVDG